MPAPSTGIIQRLAVTKAAAWNTEVVCGAGDEILVVSSPIKHGTKTAIDQSRGAGFSRDGTLGEIECSFPLTMNLRYVGLDVLISMFMGIAGAPAQQGATTAYTNAYKFAPDVYGLFVTIAKHMGPYIQTVPTAKITGLTVSGQVGAEPLQLTVDVVGTQREIASLVNTLATFASVTLPSGADRNAVMYAQTVFRMNDQTGAALGAGDVITPNKFTLSAKRKMKGEYTGQYRTTGSSPQDLVDELTNDDLPELKLTLEFASHTSTTYLSALGSDTRKKMDITSTGALIADTYHYQHLWQMPHMQMTNDDPTDDKGRIKEPLEFALHGCATAPTGMDDITDPIRWGVTNTRTSDPLA